MSQPQPYRRFGSPRFCLALLFVIWLAEPIGGTQHGWEGQTGYGWVALLALYSLSGFLVTEAALFAYPRRPAAFLANRLLRLLPGYLVAGLITWLLLWASGLDAERVLGLDPSYELLPATWALLVLLAFHGVVTLAVAAGAGLRRVAAPLLALLLLGSLAGVLLLEPGWPGFLLAAVPFFVLGATLALAKAEVIARDAALGLALAAVILTSAAVASTTSGGMPWRAWPSEAQWAGVGLWLFLLFWFWRRLKPTERLGAQASDRLLGSLSYTLYLFHAPAAVLVAWAWPQPDWISLLPMIALALLFAALYGALAEPPLRAWRERLRGHPGRV